MINCSRLAILLAPAYARYIFAAAVALAVLTGAQGAQAAAITLGTAANYALFTGLNDSLALNGGTHITGNVGLASGYNVTISGSNSETGTTYYDYTTGHGSYTVNSGGSFTEGGSIDQSMSQVVTDAETAASTAAARAATSGFATAYQNTALSVSGTSITLNAVTNLSENVLDISSLSLLNGTITLNDNGYTGAKFIINVTGGFSINSTGSSSAIIKGINGASASDVIFNIEGTGSTVSITGNSSNAIIGTIIAPQRNVTLGGGGTLSGALIAGANSLGQSYTVTSQSTGYNITGFAYQPSTTKTPEPSTIAIFGVGVLGIAAARRWRSISRR